MNRFFVSTPLGFEELVRKELVQVWPYLLGKDSKPVTQPLPEIEVLQGGLEFETDLFIALQLNFFLKSANRILLRMSVFKTKDLPKFYQKMKGLPWKEYLPHGFVEWEVAAQKSRLNNEKRLQESAAAALNEIFGKSENQESPCSKIFIRMDNDLCTISLDTTGEHLHKRGWTVLKGEAPLRETTSAALLNFMIGESSPAELKNVTLFDPMMGAGTFLTEGRSLWAGQFQRHFSFMSWKKCPKLFLTKQFAYNYQGPFQSPFLKFIGCDINEKMPKIVAENFAEVERQLKMWQRDDFVSVELKTFNVDSLKTNAETIEASKHLWIVVNPPYGERLPVAGGSVSGLVTALCHNYKPQKMGVLYPDKERVKVAQGYEITDEIKINNGGIRCLFTILTAVENC